MRRRILREPLVHFLLMGALLFGAFQVFDPRPQEAPDRIMLTARQIAGLEASFQSSWRRPPTKKERAALIDAYIREEVLVREAKALGLARNDPIIRQRLRQKMEFLLTSGAQALTPSEGDLRAFVEANPDRYRIDAQIAFEQVYLGQSATEIEVDGLRKALDSGTDPNTLGQSTLLPRAMPLSPTLAIDTTFGAGLSRQLEVLPLKVWSGPVVSGYGVHMVRVIGHSAAKLPPLEQIREAVEAGWRDAQAEELSENLYQELLDGYTVQVEDAKPAGDGS